MYAGDINMKEEKKRYGGANDDNDDAWKDAVYRKIAATRIGGYDKWGE